MKKIFEQPELMVVRMNNSDIVTLSLQGEFTGDSGDILAPGVRGFDDIDAGY